MDSFHTRVTKGGQGVCLLGAGNMDDEGIVLGPALGLKDPLHRGAVQSVGPQAVHRLRGDAQQAAPAENLRRLGRVPRL